MKKFLSILFLLALGLSTYADDIDMEEEEHEPEGHHNPHKAPYVMPHVSYEQGILSISTKYIIYNVDIIIRNSSGDVVYFVTDTLDGQYAVYLPDNVTTDMYSIELIYSGHHLIGYF